MVVGVVVFLAAGTGLLKVFPAGPTALVSLGTFWVGLGEWVNHPLQTRLVPGYKITGYPRNASLLGVFFDLLGLVLIAVGLYKLI